MERTQRDLAEDKDQTCLGLGRWRRKRALSLEQIAEATKIGVRSLQAIETEAFQKLPGGIYSTSYIKQYARAIDFDESQILALYYSVMGPDSQPVDNSGSVPEPDRGFVTRLLRHTSDVLGSLT
ncbi:MAG TPA: helix-turn-helix domain-containing protein [Bryobacteraceae bacterium]|nr:helix-turn-helix domain-containing protein [Bryobacteraceae bacterium]